MIQLVTRPNVKLNIEDSGYFTHVVVGLHFEDDVQSETHHFCYDYDIHEYIERARYYPDSIVRVLTLAEYIAEGHAYIRIKGE